MDILNKQQDCNWVGVFLIKYDKVEGNGISESDYNNEVFLMNQFYEGFWGLDFFLVGVFGFLCIQFLILDCWFFFVFCCVVLFFFGYGCEWCNVGSLGWRSCGGVVVLLVFGEVVLWLDGMLLFWCMLWQEWDIGI